MPHQHRNYVALRAIARNGVWAYRAGDRVPDSAVTGPKAWLIVGTDVEPLSKTSAAPAVVPAAPALGKTEAPIKAGDRPFYKKLGDDNDS